jgi:hypothetical protein
MRLNFEITTTKIWYLVSVPLWYAVWYTVYHLNSGIDTAPLQNSSYTTPIVPEIPVIEAQNNRGFWLPVTVVVISRPLVETSTVVYFTIFEKQYSTI